MKRVTEILICGILIAIFYGVVVPVLLKEPPKTDCEMSQPTTSNCDDIEGGGFNPKPRNSIARMYFE